MMVLGKKNNTHNTKFARIAKTILALMGLTT